MMERREARWAGPSRSGRHDAAALETPALEAFESRSIMKSTGDREISTTMAFVRSLAIMLRDKNLIGTHRSDRCRRVAHVRHGRHVPPARHLQSSKGQLYEPMDADQLMFYKESENGSDSAGRHHRGRRHVVLDRRGDQLQRHGEPMIPFFIYYSMFGFQRIGDLAWAAGDQRARGFLLGGTSGRTTLNGEGLQHEDGHSHMISATVPNCISYDPTFAYEVAVILQDGLRRMYAEREDVYYYITLMNENYTHPDMPKGAEEGIRKGLYQLRSGADAELRVQLMGSGAILRCVMAAAELLEEEFGVSCDVFSATSFTELRRDGEAVERRNRLNPGNEEQCWVEQVMAGQEGPVIAATDYVRSFAEQIRPFLPQERYVVLGTDGYGRSDTRENLRRHFEVDREYVAYSALYALYRDGKFSQDDLLAARDRLGIDPDRDYPLGA